MSRLAVRGLAAAILASSDFSHAAAQMLVGDGSVTCGAPYVIASGDTLSGIAGRAYGDPMLYGFIADENWDALSGDPENIAVGMPIMVPCVDASGQLLTPEQAADAAGLVEAAVAVEGPLDAAELDALLGPVALFPDQVLTLVLVAVTFPLDVVKAGRFVEGAADLTDQERAAQAADQLWDESVRELAAGFPDLLTRMNDNIDWTEQAGEAVVAQTDDVLAAVQRLRAKAQENGYLLDNEAQTVESVGETIVVAPADPNVVYVPTYDSQVVYTTPVTGPPVYHYGYDDDWDDALVAGGIILGGAVILDEIFDDDDWDDWDIDDEIDWDGGDITIDRGDVDIDIDRGDVSIGDGDRTQVDRDALGSTGARVGAIDRPRAGALPADRASISNRASRDAARQKIQARQSFGVQPAILNPTRPDRTSFGGAQSTTRAAPVSRPHGNRSPTARAPSRSNAFARPSGGHRTSAASRRGRSSMGGRGGGRGGSRGRR